MVDGVGDEEQRAVAVVEDGEVGGEHHRELGQVEVVAAGVGHPLPAAHRVVGDRADHAARERRQARDAVGRELGDGVAQGLGRVAGGGHADRRVADPVGLAVALGQGRGAAGADDRVARPHAAVLGGLEQERARLVPRELAVDADRRLAVGEQPPHDGDDPAVLEGELGEDLQARPGLPPREVCVWCGRRSEGRGRVGHAAILAHPPVCRAAGSAASAAGGSALRTSDTWCCHDDSSRRLICRQTTRAIRLRISLQVLLQCDSDCRLMGRLMTGRLGRRSGGRRVGRADGGRQHPSVEAGAVAGVAGRADLVDGDEQRVTVAVEPTPLTHWT